MTLVDRKAASEAPPRVLFSHAPEGCDALALAKLVSGAEQAPFPGWPTAAATWVHVAVDDARMARLASLVGFFAPDLEILTFPAWDCLPYDRVGPHADILAARIDTLSRLTSGEAAGRRRLLITTVNATLQRVLPRRVLEGRELRCRAGEVLSQEELMGFLSGNGYRRSETVSEPGEFAIRGGIVDLYPPGTEEPLRLDFFGDEVESIRTFDALSQRSTGKVDGFALRPVSEAILEPETIESFRRLYRESFGNPKDDPLYEAISAGRVHPGMEHWLPLFYGELETLFAYLPDAPVTLDHQAPQARDTRLETIEDFFEARSGLQGAEYADAWIYKPLPPDRLYMGAVEWEGHLAEHPGGRFEPFAAASGEHATLDVGGRPSRDFADARAHPESDLFGAVLSEIKSQQKDGRRVVVSGFSAGTRGRLQTLLQEHGLSDGADVESGPEIAVLPRAAVAFATLALERGFATDELFVLTEQDILGERLLRPRAKRRRADNFLKEVSALHEQDLVVHVEHGIGRYEGLETLEVHGAPHDCLKVLYHGGDRLYVPVENIDILSRYGSEEGEVELDRLGGVSWQHRRAKVKQRIRDIARKLMAVAAQRQMQSTASLEIPEGAYEELCARFPYPETEDQQRAIEDTLADLGSERPMDRLVCGDVGFGKTEVAIRAAFVTAMNGTQVAIVVPTTLLARQHYQTFRERYAGFPVNVRHLSRLTGARENQETREGLAKGTVDVVIGTHTLLSKKIAFRDLGLLIVDEEQHFGVKQKERLKDLKQNVHVLTLTATPIPRTLQLAMSGVKEMSLIATPPVDRLAVRTFILPTDPVVIREAIMREHFRGGQTFCVCPRVSDLAEVRARLAELVPEVKVGEAHGQLAASALEDVMTAFYERRFDVLLSTNIVESGLDIPTANTLIVYRSDMFGLAQLYQLRGRIGRSKVRGYAYFTLPPGRVLTAAAEKRLHAMQTLDSLGAGFQLASHDMDIRGAGNLLGEEQSGHIREVGIELYQQMLEDAVADIRSGASDTGAPPEAAAFTPQISLGTSVLIPESYVRDLNVRLGLYRRLGELETGQDIEAFAAELEDRFGSLPEEVRNLLQVIRIKQLCRSANVEKIDAGPKGALISFHKDQVEKPEQLIAFIQRAAGKVKLRPDHKLLYRRTWPTPGGRLEGVRGLLQELVQVLG